MSVAAFLDTNVWIYAATPRGSDRRKREIAEALIAADGIGTSAQVVQEFYNATVRRRPQQLTHDQAQAWIASILRLPFVAIDEALVRAALAHSARYDITGYDGAIVAAAERLGATTLHTEDLNDGQVYGRVRVVNPFRAA